MQFRILGPLEVEDDGRPVTVAGAKQRSLLALLLLRANHVVSRDTLIEGLWGGGQPRRAEHSLEAHVSRLRKRLHRNGQDVVLTRPGGYVLIVSEGELDRDRFERLTDEARAALRSGDESSAADLLRDALSLWRGKPLEDVPLDSFAVTEIGGIEDRHLSAYEDLFEAELAQGNEAEILPELERLVRLNPLRERLRTQLMLALYRCGRQAEALDEYRHARRQLADDLGIEPGPELRELEQAILRQDERLASPASTAPVPAGGRSRRHHWLVAGSLGAATVVAGGIAAVLSLGSASSGLARVGPNAVGLINPRSGRIAAQVPVGAAPGRFAVGGGGVWVTNTDADTVSRIDPLKWIRVQTITVGSGPSGIASGDGAVWVTTSLDGTLSRIDPATNSVVQTIPVGNWPVGVAVGAHSVWVANVADRSITRIDAVTGNPQRTIDVAANELLYADGALWATNTSGNSVTRIDPATNTPVEPIPVGTGPSDLAYGDGSVWVANDLDGTVSRIDPTTNSISATFPVGGSPNGIAAGTGGIWVTDDSGAVVRIDPNQNRVVQRIGVGDRPTGVAVDDAGGRVLIGVRASGAGHRGGTLKMRTNFISSIDSGVAYGVNEWSVLSITGDGLVGFDRSGGSEGTQIVPDLAVSVPTPTNFGKTYTFRIRPNIRYSNGRLVKASDLQYALTRDFRLGSASAAPPNFYKGIVGGAACARAPRRCSLSKGIVTNDAGGTITFHLRAPDPEFLYKLALPFAYAVPAGTPARDVGTHPLPATGPYAIAAYRPKRLLRLVRNVHFRRWSSAAQPDGYPNQIVMKLGGSAHEALGAVERGEADVWDSWGPGTTSAARLRDLRTRHTSQLHANPRPVTVGFFLNTHLPPFDDVNARRALNYAADRAAAIRRLGGPNTGHPTCQILPPDFPGFAPYCPYTLGSDGSRRWVAADLAAARRLVSHSPTKGGEVTVWFDPWARQWLNDLGPYVVGLLNSLGYRASVQVTRPTTKTNHEQIGFVAWGADYPSAWDFLTPLSCGSWSQFCDSSVDHLQERALEIEASNPQAANLLWARVDRRFVDEAAWLPLATPRWIDFLSKRVGNYEYSPEWGMLLDQLWVR